MGPPVDVYGGEVPRDGLDVTWTDGAARPLEVDAAGAGETGSCGAVSLATGSRRARDDTTYRRGRSRQPWRRPQAQMPRGHTRTRHRCGAAAEINLSKSYTCQLGHQYV